MNALWNPIDYWRAGGPLLIPLALVCMGIWAYFLRTWQALREALHTPVDFDDALARSLVRDGPTGVSHRMSSTHHRALSATVAHALEAVRRGQQAGDAFDTCQAAQLENLNRDTVVLAALTAVAPLLGLLGTVMGMVQTFQAVSLATGSTADHMASGISSALITTQFGLVIAIPGVFGLALLHRLGDRLRMQFAVCKTHLLLGLERRGAS